MVLLLPKTLSLFFASQVDFPFNIFGKKWKVSADATIVDLLNFLCRILKGSPKLNWLLAETFHLSIVILTCSSNQFLPPLTFCLVCGQHCKPLSILNLMKLFEIMIKTKISLKSILKRPSH